jgi:hypothetical protein
VVRPTANGAVTTGVAVDPGFLLVDPDAALNQASLDTIHRVTLTVVDQVSNRFVSGDTLAATVSGAITAPATTINAAGGHSRVTCPAPARNPA